MSDEQVLLTADQAISLLPAGATVHNFVQSSMMMLGCDYQIADAIKALRDAKSIEIGGPSCKAMKHPIAVFAQDERLSFFEADMDKVAAFEAALLKAGAPQ